jgi:hypothetical protein
MEAAFAGSLKSLPSSRPENAAAGFYPDHLLQGFVGRFVPEFGIIIAGAVSFLAFVSFFAHTDAECPHVPQNAATPAFTT